MEPQTFFMQCVGSNARPQAIQTDHQQRTDVMDGSSRGLAHSSFQGQRCTIPALPCDGWTTSLKVVGVWCVCACSRPRCGERIWESLTETGRQVEIRTPGRTHEGVVYARSVRRISEHSWSTENLPAASQQKSSSTHHQKCTKRRRKNPQRSQWVTKTKKRKGAIGHHDDASSFELKQR